MSKGRWTRSRDVGSGPANMLDGRVWITHGRRRRDGRLVVDAAARSFIIVDTWMRPPEAVYGAGEFASLREARGWLERNWV